MRLLQTIPNYEAIVQPLKGKVREKEGYISVGNIEVPKRFYNKLYKRAGELTLQEAIDTKEIYLRGRIHHGSVDWFGLVTDKFMSMPIAELGQALHTSTNGVIRYEIERERFVVSYGIGKFPENTQVFLDSADFGTYGGNGEMSVRVGVALYGPGRNRVAVLLDDSIKQRFIHRWDKNEISDVVNSIQKFGKEMATNLEEESDAMKSYFAEKDIDVSARQLSLFSYITTIPQNNYL